MVVCLLFIILPHALQLSHALSSLSHHFHFFIGKMPHNLFSLLLGMTSKNADNYKPGSGELACLILIKQHKLHTCSRLLPSLFS